MPARRDDVVAVTTHRHHWHNLPASEVVQLLQADLEQGLSSVEATRRLEIHGPNRLRAGRGKPAWVRFLRQFQDPLLYILLAASLVTLLLGEYVDALVIFLVVLANAFVGFLQEDKAEKAIEALSRMVLTEATVRRDGRKQRVRSEDIVPGDIVLLQSGDRVPADLRLFRMRGLQVDESALTGESVPVFKHADAVALESILAERKNLAFAGTLVTSGQGEGVVWATGNETETGRIARLIAEAVDLSTPLTRKIAQFSKVLLWIIMALAAVTFGVGVIRGENLVEMFMAAVALAVGAIPEGLPAAVTITLAIGVARMARRRAIIRKLPAVEALGSTTVICSDKTGTLTENQMTVQEVYAGGKRYQVTGAGYQPKGAILFDGTAARPGGPGALHECLKAGVLCNDSQVVEKEGRWTVQGDPTEAALIVAAKKGGLEEVELTRIHPRIDSIPFESEHQFMATLHAHHEGSQRVIYKKGSVERLLDRCVNMLCDDGTLAPLDRDAVHAVVEAMADRGLRVLGFARRMTPGDHAQLEAHHVSGELTFLGLQAMMDPPRQEAIAAVRKCQAAGIEVKMITGDHAHTAAAIATQLGLAKPNGGPLVTITGRELEALSDEELPEVADRASVFARVAPEQKLKLVRALQRRGHVVAMTGDGVNDAPALKQADIGVAMGLAGTDVAKGAADMLLTDDNFASIEAAVEEGRGVFDNLSKFIIWTLPTNGGEGLLLLSAVLLGTALPALPVQFLWVNMMTATLLGLMLVFEPRERDLMQRAPRDPQAPILTYPLFMRTGLVSLLILVGAFGLFVAEQDYWGASLAEARTVVVNVIVLAEVFYLLNCRSLLHSMFSVGVFSNRWIFAGIGGMIAAQVMFVHLPLMNRLFHTAPVSAGSWLRAFLVGLAIWLVVELEKWIRLKAGAEVDGQMTHKPLKGTP